MTDELATSSTPAPETAAPADAAGSPPTPAPEAQASPTEGTTSESPDFVSVWKTLSPEQKRTVLAADDPDELIRTDDRLQGKVGKLAQQQAERLVQQRQQQWEAEREQRELLRRVDETVKSKDAYGALDLLQTLSERQGQTDAQRQMEQARQQLTYQGGLQAWDKAVAWFQSDDVPAPVRAKLGGKSYADDPWEATNQFYRDIADAVAEHRAEQKMREREPAIRKDALTAALGGEPSPDLHAGAPPGARIVTDEDIRRMDLREYDALFDDRGQPKPGVVYRAGGRGRAA